MGEKPTKPVNTGGNNTRGCFDSAKPKPAPASPKPAPASPKPKK